MTSEWCSLKLPGACMITVVFRPKLRTQTRKLQVLWKITLFFKNMLLSGVEFPSPGAKESHVRYRNLMTSLRQYAFFINICGTKLESYFTLKHPTLNLLPRTHRASCPSSHKTFSWNLKIFHWVQHGLNPTTGVGVASPNIYSSANDHSLSTDNIHFSNRFWKNIIEKLTQGLTRFELSFSKRSNTTYN